MAGKKIDLTVKNGFFGESLAVKGLPCVSWRFRFKVPISSEFVFSYLILYTFRWTSAQEKFDLDKIQYFL